MRPVEVRLEAGEKLEQLSQGLFIIQHEQGYRFSVDAVLLAGFVEPKPGENIFDLGTGSGVIPLLLWLRENRIRVTGLEIQPRLASQAQRSVLLNGLEDRITIIQGDLRELPEEWLGRWDTVVTNPPFFPGAGAGRINTCREKAVARHEIACTLAEVVAAAGKLLKRKGRFLLIHKPERLPELLELLGRHGFKLSRLAFVHPKENRPANLMLVEAVLGGGKPPLILPPVVMRDEKLNYTPQLEKLFAGGNLFS